MIAHSRQWEFEVEVLCLTVSFYRSLTDGSVSMDLSYPGNQPLGYYAPPGTAVAIVVGQDRNNVVCGMHTVFE